MTSTSYKHRSEAQSAKAQEEMRASQETETASLSRHVLPRNLDAAIKQLNDQDLDRLVSATLEERARRRKHIGHQETQRKREADPVSLPQGKLNAVRAAFKAGVTPARIAREFGISHSSQISIFHCDVCGWCGS
jgi:hypothetical protein